MPKEVEALIKELKQLSQIEKIASSEDSPGAASAAQELISRLKAPQKQQTDYRPLFALASPSVGQRLLQATKAPETREQRLGQAADLELALAKLQKSRKVAQMSGVTPDQQIKDIYMQQGVSEAEIDSAFQTSPKAALSILDRIAKSRRPSDRQIQNIQDLDTPLIVLQDLEKTFDPSYVGPFKGTAIRGLPEVTTKPFQSPEATAWRSELGRFEDAYRKAITGAQASERELKMLRKNIPNITDTPEQFLSKTRSFKNIYGQLRNKNLQNFQRSGKFVSPFVDPRAEQVVEPAQSGQYSADQEAGIQRAMQQTGMQREEIVQILTEAGEL